MGSLLVSVMTEVVFALLWTDVELIETTSINKSDDHKNVTLFYFIPLQFICVSSQKYQTIRCLFITQCERMRTTHVQLISFHPNANKFYPVNKMQSSLKSVEQSFDWNTHPQKKIKTYKRLAPNIRVRNVRFFPKVDWCLWRKWLKQNTNKYK